jgi:hypothetical protein
MIATKAAMPIVNMAPMGMITRHFKEYLPMSNFLSRHIRYRFGASVSANNY